MSLRQLQLPVTSSTPSPLAACHRVGIHEPTSHLPQTRHHFLKGARCGVVSLSLAYRHLSSRRKHRRTAWIVNSGAREDTEVLSGSDETIADSGDGVEEDEATPEDLDNVAKIKRVLELLKKNRDMIFGEVKLTVLIEDPREVERRRLLGIDDDDAPAREDLVAALEDVNEGIVPKDRVALKMLAEEMINWPNLEIELSKKRPKSKSPYARATDTGIDPKSAAKKLNMDWDTAAEMEEDTTSEEPEVPAFLGYGALYLVTAFPVIIGISVVLILFYNSLQ